MLCKKIEPLCCRFFAVFSILFMLNPICFKIRLLNINFRASAFAGVLLWSRFPQSSEQSQFADTSAGRTGKRGIFNWTAPPEGCGQGFFFRRTNLLNGFKAIVKHRSYLITQLRRCGINETHKLGEFDSDRDVYTDLSFTVDFWLHRHVLAQDYYARTGAAKAESCVEKTKSYLDYFHKMALWEHRFFTPLVWRQMAECELMLSSHRQNHDYLEALAERVSKNRHLKDRYKTLAQIMALSVDSEASLVSVFTTAIVKATALETLWMVLDDTATSHHAEDWIKVWKNATTRLERKSTDFNKRSPNLGNKHPKLKQRNSVKIIKRRSSTKDETNGDHKKGDFTATLTDDELFLSEETPPVANDDDINLFPLGVPDDDDAADDADKDALLSNEGDHQDDSRKNSDGATAYEKLERAFLENQEAYPTSLDSLFERFLQDSSDGDFWSELEEISILGSIRRVKLLIQKHPAVQAQKKLKNRVQDLLMRIHKDVFTRALHYHDPDEIEDQLELSKIEHHAFLKIEDVDSDEMDPEDEDGHNEL